MFVRIHFLFFLEYLCITVLSIAKNIIYNKNIEKQESNLWKLKKFYQD